MSRWPWEEGDPGSCRVMWTRRCPISGCEDLPCARFEITQEQAPERWALDLAEDFAVEALRRKT